MLRVLFSKIKAAVVQAAALFKRGLKQNYSLVSTFLISSD